MPLPNITSLYVLHKMGTQMSHAEQLVEPSYVYGTTYMAVTKLSGIGYTSSRKHAYIILTPLNPTFI